MNIWEDVYSRHKREGKPRERRPGEETLSDDLEGKSRPEGTGSFEEIYYENGGSRRDNATYPGGKAGTAIVEENLAPRIRPEAKTREAPAPPEKEAIPAKGPRRKFTPRSPSSKALAPYPGILSKMGPHLSAAWANVLIESKKNVETVLVCSAGGKEGTTFISYHLALYLSKEYSMKVLYLDTNLRHQVIPRVQHLPGLYSYVLENKDLASLVVKTEFPGFYLLPSGAGKVPPHITSNILSREPAEQILGFCRDNFDITIIDGQPLAASPVMIEFARAADMTLLVCRYGYSRREVSRMAVEKLEKYEIKAVGIILNDRRFPVPPAVYRVLG